MKLGMQRGLIDRAALFFMKRVVRSIVTKRTKTDKYGQKRTKTDNVSASCRTFATRKKN